MPQPTHGQQPATSRLGIPFSSPVKCGDKRKTTVDVIPLGQDAKRWRLEAKLRALQSGNYLVKSKSNNKLEESEADKQTAEVHEEAQNYLEDLPGPDLVPDDLASMHPTRQSLDVSYLTKTHTTCTPNGLRSSLVLYRHIYPTLQPLQLTLLNHPPHCSRCVQEHVK
jgi:hypothetical protein